MTPTEIKKTRLYRTLAPCVRKEDREELARMLAMVPDKAFVSFAWRCREGLWSSSLSKSFWWDDTPQGFEYWEELSRRLHRAGFKCF